MNVLKCIAVTFVYNLYPFLPFFAFVEKTDPWSSLLYEEDVYKPLLDSKCLVVFMALFLLLVSIVWRWYLYKIKGDPDEIERLTSVSNGVHFMKSMIAMHGVLSVVIAIFASFDRYMALHISVYSLALVVVIVAHWIVLNMIENATNYRCQCVKREASDK